MVSGFTSYPGFVTTDGAFDRVYNGANDTFVARLNSDLSVLSASTFLGGSADELGATVAAYGSTGVLVAGVTFSPDFPMPSQSHATHAGDADAYFVYLNTSLSDGSVVPPPRRPAGRRR